MKRILIIYGAILCINIAYAETETVNWYVDGEIYTQTSCNAGNDLILPNTPTKSGYVFRGWAPRYTQIEYIETSGTQCIDSGFKPNNNTRVVMEYMVPSSSSVIYLFGARNGYSNKSFAEWYLKNGGTSVYRSDYNIDEDAATLSNSFYDVKITVDKDKNHTILTTNNGTLLNYTHQTATFQTSYNLIIGGWDKGGTVQCANGNLKIYSFKLYDNGTLIRDMIPVLDMNDVPCLLDKVSYSLYYNINSSDFIAGPTL